MNINARKYTYPATKKQWQERRREAKDRCAYIDRCPMLIACQHVSDKSLELLKNSPDFPKFKKMVAYVSGFLDGEVSPDQMAMNQPLVAPMVNEEEAEIMAATCIIFTYTACYCDENAFLGYCETAIKAWEQQQEDANKGR